MMTRFFTNRQRAGGAVSGVFLALWLSLFCQHCLAGSAVAESGSNLPGSSAPLDHAGHQGSAPDCTGDCPDLYVLQQDRSGADTMLAPTFQPLVQNPTASAARDSYRISEQPLLHHPPERSLRHPLTLTSIQLK